MAATFSASAWLSGRKRMIDRRHLDQTRPRRRAKQEQGEAVRTARNGNAQPFARCNQPIEVTSEALDQLLFRHRQFRHRHFSRIWPLAN